MSDTYIGNTPAGAGQWYADTPVGAIMAWPNSILPLGWIECNGQSTTPFPELNTLIGAVAPDLRGEFIRGFDNGKGTDSGRVLGSSQADANKSHNHAIERWNIGSSGDYDTNGKILGTQSNAGGYADGATKFAGDEARPVNVALKYIIKAFNVLNQGQISSYLSSNKNYIDNPTFEINQRAFPGGALAATIHGYDRWRSSYTGLNVSTVDASGFITITGASTSGLGFFQKVPELGFTGQVTLSWEGTSQVSYYDANGGTYSALESSPVTFDMVNVGTTAGVSEFLVWGNGTLKNVKLEKGAIVTPFEYPIIAEELAKCQRYYQQFHSSGTGFRFLAGLVSSVDAFEYPITFPVTFRITPTFSSTGTFTNYNANTTFTSIAAGNATNRQASVFCTKVAHGQTIRDADMLRASSANEILKFTADL